MQLNCHEETTKKKNEDVMEWKRRIQEIDSLMESGHSSDGATEEKLTLISLINKKEKSNYDDIAQKIKISCVLKEMRIRPFFIGISTKRNISIVSKGLKSTVFG